MSKNSISLLLLLLINFLATQASSSPTQKYLFAISKDTLFVSDTSHALELRDSEIFLPMHQLTKDEAKKKKLISAILAFPFPFGFMGAHRVMLGCKPWIPVVYVATFGGCFGLLPLIDFCVIVFSKDIEQYENNPHVFMWLK